MDLSVVIPCYRSANTLPELTKRLLIVLEGLELDYEIVLVEDGSPDNTWQVIRQLHTQRPDRVVAVQLMRNYGQHNAVMCGWRQSRGDIVVTMDDDLQNLPEEIPKLLAVLDEQDCDLVYGTYESKRHHAWRNVGSQLIQAFHRRVFRTTVPISAFRAIRRTLVEATFSYGLNFTFIDGLLSWNTQRIGQVAVEHQPRKKGPSGYSLTKLAVHAVNIFTNFSLMPLQLVSACGVVAAAGGLGMAGYLLVQHFVANNAVPGYASTIVAVLVLGGVQLLALGIMGEYLGRLHLNVNRKPQYVIRTTLGEQAGSIHIFRGEASTKTATGTH